MCETVAAIRADCNHLIERELNQIAKEDKACDKREYPNEGKHHVVPVDHLQEGTVSTLFSWYYFRN